MRRSLTTLLRGCFVRFAACGRIPWGGLRLARKALAGMMGMGCFSSVIDCEEKNVLGRWEPHLLKNSDWMWGFDCIDRLRLLRMCVTIQLMAQRGPGPSLPSEDEAIIAKETSRVLASHVKTAKPLELRVGSDRAKATVKLPASAARMLIRILDEMAHGNAVTLIPVRAELTTQEAADLLNISRPSLIQLLDEGKIEFRRVRTHRRVGFKAVTAYKRRLEEQRRAALAELAAYDQELGI